MKGRYAIIGLGAFGFSLARHLARTGNEVTVIDKSRERVEEIAAFVAAPFILDCTERKAMASVDFRGMDTVVIAIGDNLGTTVLTLALLIELGVGSIYVRVTSERERTIMLRLGAKGTIFPAEAAGRSFASTLGFEGSLESMPIGESHTLVRVRVPEVFYGRSLAGLRLREEYAINLVTLMEPTKVHGVTLRCLGVPEPSHVLHQGEEMLVFGREDHLQAFLETFAPPKKPS